MHAEHLNTPRLVADSAGAVVWRWDQVEPFGVNVPDENPSGLGAFEMPLRFPGQYADKETGLHYNYYRDYDPSLGIYKQSDLIGLRGGINTYTYVGGSPTSKIDPNGLDNPFLYPMVSSGLGGPTSKSCAPKDDCDDVVVVDIVSSTACRSGDALCVQAMQAGGFQGPFVPRSRVYSTSCLLNALGIKGGTAATTAAVLSKAPTVLANLGASGNFQQFIGVSRAIGNSPAGTVVGISAATAIALQTCECSPIRYGPYGKITSSN